MTDNPAILDLIAQMTLEEKASLCSGRDYWHFKGIPRLGIPAILVTDGPHGLRKVEGDPTAADLGRSAPATCFPTASALAATWNQELVFEVGKALGEECLEEGISVLLGPGANIKRSPLCGRNFEYFSEDPYLTGKMASSHIRGLQSQGVGASLKHYAANNQEYRRMTIDAVVDERALREIYLGGFEIAVKEAQPWTVMGAYNKVNGTYACENAYLLKEVLRGEWGYEGLLITDWGAMNRRVDALQAGLEIEMPGPSRDNDAAIVAAVREGRLELPVLDAAVERILSLALTAAGNRREDYRYDRQAHHALARQAAGEGAVLLKNLGEILPLREDSRVALIGEMARRPRYQGAGSSLVNPSRMENIYQEMVSIAGEELVRFAPGYTADGLEDDQDLRQAAVALAREADVAVICAGLPERFEVEGLDRQHLRLPASHNRLIEAVTAVCSQVVVVLSNGSPVEMPWIDRVQAVLEGYLGGQAGGGAAAEMLYGRVNPSGKLAETFPLRLDDTPSRDHFPGGPATVEYRESLYVGYRYYDQVDHEVLFPFGHGLSYTTFQYSDLTLSAELISGQEGLSARLKVKNTGARPGKEIVQLYVSPEAPAAFRPPRELKGFRKVSLEGGEEQEVCFDLDRRTFAYYSAECQDWLLESGRYQIQVGASSRDIRCQASIRIESPKPDTPVGERDRISAYAAYQAESGISREDFERLLGRPLPENQLAGKGSYHLNTPIGDMTGSLAGRWLNRYLKSRLEKMVRNDPDNPNALMMRSVVENLPLRALSLLGGEAVNRAALENLLTMVNGRFFKGLFAILGMSLRKDKSGPGSGGAFPV